MLKVLDAIVNEDPNRQGITYGGRMTNKILEIYIISWYTIRDYRR